MIYLSGLSVYGYRIGVRTLMNHWPDGALLAWLQKPILLAAVISGSYLKVGDKKFIPPP